MPGTEGLKQRGFRRQRNIQHNRTTIKQGDTQQQIMISKASDISWQYFLRVYPKQTLTMLFYLVLAGGIESIGAVSIVPLLAVIFGGSISTSPLLAKIEPIFQWVGIPLTLGHMLAVISLAMLGKAGMTLLAFKETGHVEADISTRLRMEMLDGLLHARWEYYTRQPAGELTYALSTEALQAGAALRAFCQALSHAAQAVAYLVASVFLPWQLIVAAFGCSLLLLTLFRGLITKVRKVGSSQVETLNAMSTLFIDGLAGAKVLKVMGMEDTFIGYIRQHSNQHKRMAEQHAYLVGLLSSMQEPFLTILLAGGIFFSSEILRIDGTTLIATAFFFQRIVSRVSSAQQSYQQFAALEGIMQSMIRKIDAIRCATTASSGKHTATLESNITLTNICKSYSGKIVLDKTTLTLSVGSVTAFCGPSGSGKTTVADILTGLIAPDDGTIAIDGVELGTLDINAWRRQIGYVPQEVFLFNDTVRSNITFGRTFRDEDVWGALENAGAAGFVRNTPGGLDAIAGEQGRLFSGGQRQRLMVARALIGNPKLLILDEATTGLDSKTEIEILESIQRLKHSMAIVVISHSPAVQKYADHYITFHHQTSVEDQQA